MRRFEKYKVKRGVDLGSSEFWNPILEDLDLRLAARELDGEKIDGAVAEITQVALTRLNDTFTPVLQEALDKLASAGAFFEASSGSEVTLGLGAKSFVIDTANRTGWVVTDYVVISALDEPGVGMVANVLDYDRVSGIVEVDVLVVVGSGTYDSWRLRVSAPPDLEHATRTDNPHQTTAAQVGAYTTVQVDAALATLTTAYNNAIAAAIAALGLGTAAQKAVAFFATAAQGAKADSALQPGDIGAAVLAPNGNGIALTGIAKVAPGDIIVTFDATPRAGHVELNGATITNGATDFPAVAARYPWMVSGGNIILPDARGRFLRSWAHGAAADPDRASRTARAGDGAAGDVPGTYQSDEFKSHSHGTVVRAEGPGNVTNGAGTAYSGGATDPTGGNETRPKNINVVLQMRLTP